LNVKIVSIEKELSESKDETKDWEKKYFKCKKELEDEEDKADK
jgi:hypothetical protein